MKVRFSIVYEFDRLESLSRSKSSLASDAIVKLYNMPVRDLEGICRVQVAKETWINVED